MSDASVATKQAPLSAGTVPRPSLAERDRRHALIREGKGRVTTGIPLTLARGLGDDGPGPLRKPDPESFQNTPLQKGMTFILKPRLIEVGCKERASLGDMIAVTATGAKRLEKRPQE